MIGVITDGKLVRVDGVKVDEDTGPVEFALIKLRHDCRKDREKIMREFRYWLDTGLYYRRRWLQ